MAGHWRWRLRRGGSWLGTAFPSTERALRAVGGDAADLLAYVAWRTGRQAPVRGKVLRHRAPIQHPAVPQPSSPADSDCRKWRTKDLAAGRTLCRCLQSATRTTDPAKVGDSAPTL